MRKVSILLLAVFLALFVGCSKENSQTMAFEAVNNVESSDIDASKDTVSSENTTSGVVSESDSPYVEGYQKVVVAGETVLWDGYKALEPDSKLDIWNMKPSDFGEFFTKTFEVTKDSYKLMEGTLMETEVVHIHSENEGPCVYIVGAVHGDEKAAWYAAILTEQATISCGDLYILAPANANGAKNDTRYVVARQDMNRVFPGDPEGNEAERIADAIFSDIAEKRPSFVFDLHEAIIMTSGRDFLGSSYIFTKLDGMEDLFFDMVFATQDGTICHNEFSVNGPGPDGSVNNTVTNLLRIPTVTVETFRGFHIERRVYDQLDTIQFVLNYLGML
jgi:hypothetical protein